LKTTIIEVGDWDELEEKVNAGEFKKPDRMIYYGHGEYYEGTGPDGELLNSDLYYVLRGQQTWMAANEDCCLFAIWNTDPTQGE